MPVYLYALSRLAPSEATIELRSILSTVTRIAEKRFPVFEQSDRNLVDRETAGFDPYLLLHFVQRLDLYSRSLELHFEVRTIYAHKNTKTFI